MCFMSGSLQELSSSENMLHLGNTHEAALAGSVMIPCDFYARVYIVDVYVKIYICIL